MFRSFLTQEKLDQDPEKTVQSNDLSLYVPPLLTRMIKQLCIAGWSEQGGVEEGEASTVHDPQVLQGGQITFQQYIRMYNVIYDMMICKCIFFLSSSPYVQRIHRYLNGLEWFLKACAYSIIQQPSNISRGCFKYERRIIIISVEC